MPHSQTVVQEGDLVHVVMTDEQRDHVLRVFAAGPSDGA